MKADSKHTRLSDRGVVGRWARYDEVESLEIALVKLPITVYGQLYSPGPLDIYLTHLLHFFCVGLHTCVPSYEKSDTVAGGEKKSSE